VKQFACPAQRKYPLNTRARAKNAHARYHQARTAKCEGGHERICRALKKYGIKGYDCK
jgi:hypothetical protein